jgi:hypothetical protein
MHKDAAQKGVKLTNAISVSPSKHCCSHEHGRCCRLPGMHAKDRVPCLTSTTCRAKLTSLLCCAATTAVILLLCRVVLNGVNDCILHLLRAVRPDVGLLIRCWRVTLLTCADSCEA